jgi:hypothetical protein
MHAPPASSTSPLAHCLRICWSSSVPLVRVRTHTPCCVTCVQRPPPRPPACLMRAGLMWQARPDGFGGRATLTLPPPARLSILLEPTFHVYQLHEAPPSLEGEPDRSHRASPAARACHCDAPVLTRPDWRRQRRRGRRRRGTGRACILTGGAAGCGLGRRVGIVSAPRPVAQWMMRWEGRGEGGSGVDSTG